MDEAKLSREMAVKLLIKQCEKVENASRELKTIFNAFDDIMSFANGTATEEQMRRLPVATALLADRESAFAVTHEALETIHASLCAMTKMADLTAWDQ